MAAGAAAPRRSVLRMAMPRQQAAPGEEVAFESCKSMRMSSMEQDDEHGGDAWEDDTVYSVFMGKNNNPHVHQLVAELHGISVAEATRYCQKPIVALAKEISCADAKELQQRFAALNVTVRITKREQPLETSINAGTATPAPSSKETVAGGGLASSIARLFGLSKSTPAQAPELQSQSPVPTSDATGTREIREKQEYHELSTFSLMQRADGSFELTTEFANFVNINSIRIRIMIQKLPVERAFAERIVATLIALDTFEGRFPDIKDAWKLLAEKAERWLAAQKVAVPQGFTDLRAWFRAEMAGK
jgi:hypothetical protein